jgi:peptidoglycan glycosyltransferase
MIMSAIANGGILMKPYLINSVENAGGDAVKKFMPSAYGELMAANESKALTDLLVQVVKEGTGSALRTDAYQAAGKTGSAEFETGKETHAWFVGFAPVEDPKIAVCVIVEEGGSGGQTAAPIARKLFDAWLNP